MTPEQIEDRMTQALHYLTGSDEKAADLKFEVGAAEHRYENAVDAHFLCLEGPIDQRKAKARQDCQKQYIEFLEARRAYDRIMLKRQSESLVVEAVRSLMANYRQGKV